MSTEPAARQQKNWLRRTYPLAFNCRIARPLKIGIHRDILAQHPEMDPRNLQKMLDKWCHRMIYQKALSAGGHRVDLQGEPAGEVTPEQMKRPAGKVKRREEKAKANAARAAAARSAPVPTPAAADVPKASARPILSLKRAEKPAGGRLPGLAQPRAGM